MRITLLAALIYSIGVCGANLSFAAEPETEVAPLATKPPADGTKPGQAITATDHVRHASWHNYKRNKGRGYGYTAAACHQLSCL